MGTNEYPLMGSRDSHLSKQNKIEWLNWIDMAREQRWTVLRKAWMIEHAISEARPARLGSTVSSEEMAMSNPKGGIA